ncbi:MAG: beta-phosphoglucomutase [Anaerolineae bacterium]|nr:beta-phosphoglucomutase [Anaerolineae bacterium]
MNLSLQALIFDLDGVITDTPVLHYETWRRLAAEEMIHFTPEQYHRMQGLSRRASLDIFLDGRYVSEELAQSYMARKNRYFLELLEGLTPERCFPGVREMIAEGRGAGLKIGLGSSSQNAKGVLERLGLTPSFDVIADGNTVTRAKPAPDIFLWVAGQLGVEPGRALVFEDSVAGLRAALDGGFWAVGIGGKHGPGAHVAVESLAGWGLGELVGEIVRS